MNPVVLIGANPIFIILTDQAINWNCVFKFEKIVGRLLEPMYFGAFTLLNMRFIYYKLTECGRIKKEFPLLSSSLAQANEVFKEMIETSKMSEKHSNDSCNCSYNSTIKHHTKN